MDIKKIIQDNPTFQEDIVFYDFLLNRSKLEDFFYKKKQVTICTLGPSGTTSSEAVIFFKNYIKNILDVECKIVFMNNFDAVHQSIYSENVDLILIPNPYENITKIYWDQNIEYIYNFSLYTPEYGLAKKKDVDLKKKDLIIASGPAVDSFIEKLLKDIDGINKYSIYPVNSTLGGAIAVVNGEADLAVTNSTSASLHNLDFVSSTMNAKVLWSIFKKKDSIKL